MADELEKRVPQGNSRRRVPRFAMQAPLDVAILRSGVSDKVHGRSTDVGERGIAAMIAGELIPGEMVEIEIVLSSSTEPLRTKAVVRYQDKLRCGLEFVAISAEHRAVVRDWARDLKQPGYFGFPITHLPEQRNSKGPSKTGSAPSFQKDSTKHRKYLRWVWIVLFLIVSFASIYLWRWNRSWKELESGLRLAATPKTEMPAVKVPAEVMEKLLVHRVEPAYPDSARKQNLQGLIALEIVVGRDGSVLSMHPLNGPDLLARAAMDSLRWWKFEPYRVNGEPVVVESTVAVEFKK